MSAEPKSYTNTHKGQITYKGQQANTTIGKGKPTTEEGGKSVKWLRGFDTREKCCACEMHAPASQLSTGAD